MKKTSLSFFIASALLVALLIGVFTGSGRFPMEARFGIAAFLLFGFGQNFQTQALAEIARFRPKSLSLLWLIACSSFWYSLAIWIWWARRSPSFPLFLLNEHLGISVYFELSAVAVVGGMALIVRNENSKR